ncbi:MAG: hypothetical protein WC455_27485 [Dehalococcoidia bacterium]|jgi:hypothetical protein
MQKINNEAIDILWAALDREVVIPPVAIVADVEFDLLRQGEVDFVVSRVDGSLWEYHSDVDDHGGVQGALDWARSRARLAGARVFALSSGDALYVPYHPRSV